MSDLPRERDVEGPSARSVDALPTTGTDVPGVWIIATESATRYVIVVPPEGPARAVRLSWYGRLTGEWKTYRGASVLERREEPVRVGERARIQIGPNLHSTVVLRIDAYEVDGASALRDIEAVAQRALTDTLVAKLAEGHRGGRLGMEQVAEVCDELGLPLDQVHDLLRAPSQGSGQAAPNRRMDEHS